MASPLLVLGMMTLVSRLWCVLASERLAGAIAFFLKLRCVRALEPQPREVAFFCKMICVCTPEMFRSKELDGHELLILHELSRG